MTFRTRIQLRWVDLDAQLHVNNTLAVDYLQEARTRFMVQAPGGPSVSSGWVVAKHRVGYLKQINFSPRPLDAQVCTLSVGAAKVVVDYLLEQDGDPVVRAHSVLCPYDFGAHQLRRLTDAERDFFRERMEKREKLAAIRTPHLKGRGVDFELSARWTDQDAYGHINNASFFDYVQEARIAATIAADPTMARPGTPSWDTRTASAANYRWLLARQDIDYVNQMAWRVEPYRVLTAVSRVGRTSVTFAAEVVDPLAHNLVLARTRTILVCGDQDSRPTTLPPTTRQAMQDLLVE